MAPNSTLSALQARAARQLAIDTDPDLEARISFDRVWRQTNSLSAAAQVLLSQGIEPKTIISLLQRNYINMPLPQTEAAIQAAFPNSPQEIQAADATAYTDIDSNQENRDQARITLFYQRAAILLRNHRPLDFVVASEAPRIEDVRDADEIDKIISEIELGDLRNIARVLVEQQAFRRVQYSNGTSRNPDNQAAQLSELNKMIAAGAAATSVFDERLAAKMPLTKICSEALAQETQGPPTRAQVEAVKKGLGQKSSNRLIS